MTSSTQETQGCTILGTRLTDTAQGEGRESVTEAGWATSASCLTAQAPLPLQKAIHCLTLLHHLLCLTCIYEA